MFFCILSYKFFGYLSIILCFFYVSFIQVVLWSFQSDWISIISTFDSHRWFTYAWELCLKWLWWRTADDGSWFGCPSLTGFWRHKNWYRVVLLLLLLCKFYSVSWQFCLHFSRLFKDVILCHLSHSGLPFPRVNLLNGVREGTINENCPAGAGSLLLEFAILSRLLGDSTYESLARRTNLNLWSLRNKETGLLGRP